MGIRLVEEGEVRCEGLRWLSYSYKDIENGIERLGIKECKKIHVKQHEVKIRLYKNTTNQYRQNNRLW